MFHRLITRRRRGSASIPVEPRRKLKLQSIYIGRFHQQPQTHFRFKCEKESIFSTFFTTHKKDILDFIDSNTKKNGSGMFFRLSDHFERPELTIENNVEENTEINLGLKDQRLLINYFDCFNNTSDIITHIDPNDDLPLFKSLHLCHSFAFCQSIMIPPVTVTNMSNLILRNYENINCSLSI